MLEYAKYMGMGYSEELARTIAVQNQLRHQQSDGRPALPDEPEDTPQNHDFNRGLLENPTLEAENEQSDDAEPLTG
jgi:hypothetical protein